MSLESSSSVAPSVACKLLKTLYPKVDTLHVYLCAIVPSFSMPEAVANQGTDADLEELQRLLSSTLIGYDDSGGKVSFASQFPEMEQEEVIDHAQLIVFKESRTRINNVLCLGYRQAEQRNELGKIGAQRGAIANFFINTMVTALHSPPWRSLLKIIGEEPMIHLLARTSIFLSLPGDQDCFAQATGTVITDLQALADKNVKSDTGKMKHTAIRSPVDINILRARMFYGRPKFTGQDKVRFGLPSKHVLNRVLEYTLDHNIKAEREMEAAARHVAKYMFPLQYNLHNVFTCTLNYWENGGRFRDYGDRESEIEGRGSCKTPGRIKKVLSLVQSLIKRHKHFNYQRACAGICKSRMDQPTSAHLDQSKILELMSEYSQSIIANYTMSQIPDKSYQVSHPSLVLPHGASEAALETKLKPRFAEFACSHHEVLRYVKIVVDSVIPHAFWGSSVNRRVIDGHIEKVVTQRRFETLTLHNLMQKLCVADCEWLGETMDRRVCRSDAIKRAELLREFVYWFFDSFLMPLIRSSFYVTETSALQHQLLYFRHDDWHKLCIPLLDKLSGETFERIDPSELNFPRRLGTSHVRLLPKETGVRPIVNLGRKAKVKQAKPSSVRQKAGSRDEPLQPSVNQVLNATFHILNYEKTQKPEMLGASVFGSNDIYRKISAFKSSVIRPDGSMPKLYFVKLDVRACFDSIEQGKLLDILRTCLTQDGYMIRKFNQVQFSTGQTRRSFHKRAVPDLEHTHFMTYAARLAACLRHVIFSDQVVYGFDYQEETLELLEEHITDNIVRIGSEYYRQVIGIPQGSTLSTLLCAIFYGNLEETELKFTQDPGNLLLRFVDDYLFVTTNSGVARKFLKIMHQGHPEYGCEIAEEKTLTNFADAEVQTLVLAPENDYFPWCGRMIHMKELSVQWDYSRYKGKHVAHGLTVDYGRKPGTKFRTKILQMARQHCHAMYLDASLTSLRNLYVNVAQNFFWVAMKMYNYVREWGIRVDQHGGFIGNIITQVVHYAFTSMRSRMNGSLAKELNAIYKFDCNSIHWIGFQSFHWILSHKHDASWAKIVAMLLSQVHSRRYKHARVQLSSVVREVQVSMAHIMY